MIFPYAEPLAEKAGFLVLKRQPVRFRDHEGQRHRRRLPRARYLSQPGQEGVFEARAIVFRRLGRLSQARSTTRP
ncbi:hypothetical protein ACRAWD_28055 [Caulobacter segnis]